MNILAAAIIMLVSILPTSAGSKHQPPIAYDDERQLTAQMSVIDIPVLANDVGPGPHSLYLVAVNGTQGGRDHRRSNRAGRHRLGQLCRVAQRKPQRRRRPGSVWDLHHQQRLRPISGDVDDQVSAGGEYLTL